MLRPSWVSLCVVLLNCSLGVTSFLIVLPTSASYTSSFGINDQLAGLLVGLSPLINGLVQPLLIPIFERFRLQHVFVANCLLTMLGNSLFALGDVSNSFGVLLLGRCILGISGGPAFATTYTVRATGTSVRTRYMGYTSISVSSGYVFGPLLAFASERIVQAANWDSQLLNSNTAPGWIMVALALFNLLLFAFLFEEPPRHKQTKATSSSQEEMPSATFSATSVAALEEGELQGVELKDDMSSGQGKAEPFCGLKTLQVAICYLLIGVTMANTGSFEISLVFRGEQNWDFSISGISLLLAAFNAVSIGLSFLRVERFVATDRQGIFICFVGLFLGSPFLFDYEALNQSEELALVVVGGLVVLFSAQTAKGFLFGLASKVPSPEYQQTVVSCMATSYTFGRFAGTFAAPFLFERSHAYGGFLLGINSLCCALFLGVYQHMGGPDGSEVSSDTKVGSGDDCES